MTAEEQPMVSLDDILDEFGYTREELRKHPAYAADPSSTPAGGAGAAVKSVAGYGRYDDDPDAIGCPRAKSDMTPCVARDGQLAQADDGVCVGCGQNPADLLKDLVRVATQPAHHATPQAGEEA